MKSCARPLEDAVGLDPYVKCCARPVEDAAE